MSVCMYTDEAFADRLRRCRERAGLSMYALAKAAQCSETEIRHLESGRTEWPSLLIGLRIARVLRVDPKYLAFGEPNES